jgi:amidophosphoribosyltransferase
MHMTKQIKFSVLIGKDYYYMGGLFGVVSKTSCVYDLFFGTDYHSHLGTRRGGLAVCGAKGFQRTIHNIENSPFRTKFEKDIEEMEGNLGIGCISDTEPQPLIVRSHLGNFAITTVGRINNIDALINHCFSKGYTHFLEMSGGDVNPTELVASLITQKNSIAEGIRYAQSLIDGSMTMLVLTNEGLYAARDRLGRTPIVIGRKEGAFCASFESFAYLNLGYTDYKELGPSEVVYLTPDKCETVLPATEKMRICTFLWVYYGYPTSYYEGVNVEQMRYNCGRMLAERDKDEVSADIVAGVPDSGTAHAVGYANASGIPFARPFIKYTPTWPRSFMPTHQSQRNLIAKMKLIPIDTLIRRKRMLLIDDSIVRGTQLRETTEFLYQSGAREVHIRPACPPLLFGCKYLNFSRSTSDLDLIARRVVKRLEGSEEAAKQKLDLYADPTTPEYRNMVDQICRELSFTSLRYHRLDDLIASVGIPEEKLCTYCWSGKE